MNLRSYPRIYFELMFAGFALMVGLSFSKAWLPVFAGSLDPDGAFVGFVVSSWFLSRIFMEIPSGNLADQISNRKLILFGLFSSAGGVLICSIANTIFVLILGRTIWGLGTALFFTCNMRVVLNLFKSGSRGSAFGLINGIELTGSFVGAPVGSFLVGYIGYRGVFLLSFLMIMCSAGIIFCSTGLRNQKLAGQIREKISIKKAFSSLKQSSVSIICVSGFFRMLLTFGVVSTLLILYFESQLHFGEVYRGTLVGFRALGFIFASLISGYLARKLKSRNVVILGFIVQGICFYFYTLFSSFEYLLAIGIVEGIGGGLIFTSLIVFLSEVVPSTRRGSVIGIYRTFMDIGGFSGPILFNYLYQTTGPLSGFLLAIGFIGCNVALLLFIKNPQTSIAY